MKVENGSFRHLFEGNWYLRRCCHLFCKVRQLHPKRLMPKRTILKWLSKSGGKKTISLFLEQLWRPTLQIPKKPYSLNFEEKLPVLYETRKDEKNFRNSPNYVNISWSKLWFRGGIISPALQCIQVLHILFLFMTQVQVFFCHKTWQSRLLKGSF